MHINVSHEWPYVDEHLRQLLYFGTKQYNDVKSKKATKVEFVFDMQGDTYISIRITL